MNDQPIDIAGAPVQPRWEWRTFGDLAEPNALLASVRAREPSESEEVYLVSMSSDASVKVRDGLLDVKVLQRVGGTGLQLWAPVAKEAFPVAAETVETAMRALGGPRPSQRRGYDDVDELVAGVVEGREDLRAVPLGKRRHRAVLDECMVEFTDLIVDGVTTPTVAIESTDPALVLETIERLGLAGRPNVCLARGLKEILGWAPTRFAVVDVGTNSVKFVLGGRERSGASYVEVDTAVVTRLGEGLERSGRLEPEPVRRTAEAIADLVGAARRGGPVAVAAVGTAGLRQAPNRDDLLDAVLSGCGVPVEVISGPEEARLAYLAAVSSLPLTEGRLLVFDSGGGSSQFTFGDRSRIEEQFSLDLGAVRITERFGLDGAVPRDTVDAALTAIADELGRLAEHDRPDQVVAIGGTSTNLAAVRHGLRTYDPEVVHGTVVDVAEVERQIELFRRRTADERRSISGLQPARAEVILAGACIVRAILAVTGQQQVTVSDRGLRHGVLAERFGAQV